MARGNAPGFWLRLAADAIVLCALTAGAVAIISRWAGRFPSAWPVGDGFSVELAELCAYPGVPDRHWRYIVVHHSATTGGGAASFARYHMWVRGWSSLGYHFVIGNGTQTADGQIEVGLRWLRQQAGKHAAVLEYNEHGIGICLVGDFRTQRPTELQMRSLEALVLHLMARYGIPLDGVLGHREVPGAATECPGPNFPMAEFRRRLLGGPAEGIVPGAQAACVFEKQRGNV